MGGARGAPRAVGPWLCERVTAACVSVGSSGVLPALVPAHTPFASLRAMASAGVESLVSFAGEGEPMQGVPGVEAPTAESDADRLSRSGLGLSTAEATDDGAALNGGTPVTPFGHTSMSSDEEGAGDDGVKRDVAHVGVLAALAALQVPAAEDCRSPLDATTEEMGGMPKNLVPAGWTMMYEEASPRETIAVRRCVWVCLRVGRARSVGIRPESRCAARFST